MPSNTAVLENQAINFHNVLAEKSDPFTIRRGHYAGSDGFVVPRDFGEFYKRFPDYVSRWVGKHCDRSAPKEDLEDWTHDLLIHLYSLPQTSNFREMGKQDTVETFDPSKHHGANQARFRNYVNVCLANKFRTMHSKSMKDALSRPGNVSFGGPTDCEDLHSVGDEYCHSHSAFLRTAVKAYEKHFSDKAFLEEFVEFVRREDPKALPAIKVIMATGRNAETAEWLRITEREFGRTRNRLCQLAECFLSG
jgi:hypothetical protein